MLQPQDELLFSGSLTKISKSFWNQKQKVVVEIHENYTREISKDPIRIPTKHLNFALVPCQKGTYRFMIQDSNTDDRRVYQVASGRELLVWRRFLQPCQRESSEDVEVTEILESVEAQRLICLNRMSSLDEMSGKADELLAELLRNSDNEEPLLGDMSLY
jgi:hypothetical protein